VGDTLGAALADVDLVIGTSAKERHDKRYLVPAAELPALLQAKGSTVRRVAVVFGCEESGLSNAELAHCHLLTSVPLAVSYPSLNLAQAVMLYAYELADLAQPPPPSAAGSGEWQALQRRLQALLARLQVPADGVLADWVRERSALLTAEDVGFLHMLCRHLEERLPAD
ncbi:MAG: TrmH family RNA methyltransferase, partial [Spongiibacteraceae bacterium]|nr:TrmH family RNA methyltransferase [Spongiibacteraceae bacterium]